jgi:hypothetical protein
MGSYIGVGGGLKSSPVAFPGLITAKPILKFIT